jgi:hypothetical protein
MTVSDVTVTARDFSATAAAGNPYTLVENAYRSQVNRTLGCPILKLGATRRDSGWESTNSSRGRLAGLLTR